MKDTKGAKNKAPANGDRDVEFIFEMGNIRLIDRMWRRFQSPHFANLAEHHFRVFWICLLYTSDAADE